MCGDAYTSNRDFHRGSRLAKLAYPIKTIYSREARRKVRLVLDDFQPDVCHLNNFTYQITPSVILEIVKWRKEMGRECRIVYTAHDYNLICPNHMLHNPNTHKNCERCLGGHFLNCVKGKCIHGSLMKSMVGTAEAVFWNWKRVYRYIDTVICPSEFLKRKMDTNPVFQGKTVAMHNFVDKVEPQTMVGQEEIKKKDYVLYFGRFSEEKGIGTLLEACRELPDVHFVFAGSGPLEEEIDALPNVDNVGFRTGKELEELISEARFSVCPSEWYENCPFSVMESQIHGTPVIGADMGGIPELIKDGKNGRLFRHRDSGGLSEVILELWNSPEMVREYAIECLENDWDDIDRYSGKLIRIYSGGA